MCYRVFCVKQCNKDLLKSKFSLVPNVLSLEFTFGKLTWDIIFERNLDILNDIPNSIQSLKTGAWSLGVVEVIKQNIYTHTGTKIPLSHATYFTRGDLFVLGVFIMCSANKS